MTYLNGTLSIERDVHRIFEAHQNIVLFVALTAVASSALIQRQIGFVQGDCVMIESGQFGIDVCLPLAGPVEAAIANKEPDLIQVTFQRTPAPDQKIQHSFTTSGYRTVTLRFMAPVFVDFFERHKAWIRWAFGGDTNTWPSLFNFARIVRNFIIHHEGRVHFDNANAPSVGWHHLNYCPADEGRLVVGGDLSFGDMIVLLFEFSDELDRLGCPLRP